MIGDKEESQLTVDQMAKHECNMTDLERANLLSKLSQLKLNNGTDPCELDKHDPAIITAPASYWRAQIRLAQAVEDFMVTPSGRIHLPQSIKDALKAVKDAHYAG